MNFESLETIKEVRRAVLVRAQHSRQHKVYWTLKEVVRMGYYLHEYPLFTQIEKEGMRQKNLSFARHDFRYQNSLVYIYSKTQLLKTKNH